MMPASPQEIAHAFNLGSDARLQGISITFNPYTSEALRTNWAAGWKHVHKHWAEVAKWRCRHLPVVDEPEPKQPIAAAE